MESFCAIVAPRCELHLCNGLRVQMRLFVQNVGVDDAIVSAAVVYLERLVRRHPEMGFPDLASVFRTFVTLVLIARKFHEDVIHAPCTGPQGCRSCEGCMVHNPPANLRVWARYASMSSKWLAACERDMLRYLDWDVAILPP